MKTKKKKPTIKELALRLERLEIGVNKLTPRAITQAKLFTELVSFMGKEKEFKEFLTSKYLPNKSKENVNLEKQNIK